jgi:hypothetical protein
MKRAWPILLAILATALVSCGDNKTDVPDSMSFEKNPSQLNPQQERQPIPSQGAPRPFEGQPQQPPESTELDCNYEVIKKNFRADPRYPEILQAVVAFEEYQDNMNVDTLTQVVSKFNNIFADTARFQKPCSEQYLSLFEGKGKVEEYASRMCEQMLLSQYFHGKFPCLRKLTQEQQISLMMEEE